MDDELTDCPKQPKAWQENGTWKSTSATPRVNLQPRLWSNSESSQPVKKSITFSTKRDLFAVRHSLIMAEQCPSFSSSVKRHSSPFYKWLFYRLHTEPGRFKPTGNMRTIALIRALLHAHLLFPDFCFQVSHSTASRKTHVGSFQIPSEMYSLPCKLVGSRWLKAFAILHFRVCKCN